MREALHSSQERAPSTKLKREAIDDIRPVQGSSGRGVQDRVPEEIHERHFKKLAEP